MLARRSGWLLAPLRDPFKILGLTRAATKAEVKMKYRELARVYHPDAEAGDSKRMEEINHAYKLLMKDGGYERLHLRGPVTANGPTPRHDAIAEARHRSGCTPFSAAEESNEVGSSSGPLSDEEVSKLSALDPTTERLTDKGKYLYQSRDDDTWVELERPLFRAHQPRYAGFAAQADMAAELQRRSMAIEKQQNEKLMFQRVLDRLADSANLPTRNPRLLRVCLGLILLAFYFMYERGFARQTHQERRREFYRNINDQRHDMQLFYKNNKEAVELAVATAAIIFLIASEQKTLEDEIQPPVPETYYRSVRPPQSHFHVVAGG